MKPLVAALGASLTIHAVAAWFVLAGWPLPPPNEVPQVFVAEVIFAEMAPEGPSKSQRSQRSVVAKADEAPFSEPVSLMGSIAQNPVSSAPKASDRIPALPAVEEVIEPVITTAGTSTVEPAVSGAPIEMAKAVPEPPLPWATDEEPDATDRVESRLVALASPEPRTLPVVDRPVTATRVLSPWTRTLPATKPTVRQRFQPQPSIESAAVAEPERAGSTAERPVASTPTAVAPPSSRSPRPAIETAARSGDIPVAATPGPVDAVPVAGNAPPQYPRVARLRGLEGRVVVTAAVDPLGVVVSSEIAETSGFAMLDRAALEAVRRWRFEPAQRNGRPVRATISVPIIFTLRAEREMVAD